MNKLEDFRMSECDILSLDVVVKHQSVIYFWGSMNMLSQVTKNQKKEASNKIGKDVVRQVAAAVEGMHNAHSKSIL